MQILRTQKKRLREGRVAKVVFHFDRFWLLSGKTGHFRLVTFGCSSNERVNNNITKIIWIDKLWKKPTHRPYGSSCNNFANTVEVKKGLQEHGLWVRWYILWNKKKLHSFLQIYMQWVILGATGFLREEPQSAISEAQSGGEKIDKRWENLWLPATVDWSYCVNRFELGSRPDPASWLEEPYRCAIIGCLLINLEMLIDTYRSMIVRFASPATRGFLSPLLSLSYLISLGRKKTSGTRVTVSQYQPAFSASLFWNFEKVFKVDHLPFEKWHDSAKSETDGVIMNNYLNISFLHKLWLFLARYFGLWLWKLVHSLNLVCSFQWCVLFMYFIKL